MTSTRRYSMQLQPIDEESGKSSPSPSSSIQQIVDDLKMNSNNSNNNNTGAGAGTAGASGHINKAYDSYGDDVEIDYDQDQSSLSSLISSQPPRPSQPPPPPPPGPGLLSSSTNRMNRQVSFEQQQQQQNPIEINPTTATTTTTTFELNNNDNSNVPKPMLQMETTIEGTIVPLSANVPSSQQQQRTSILRKNSLNTNTNNVNNEINTGGVLKEKIPEWDRFETLPPPDEDETQKSEWVEIAIKWLKLFAYLFTFLMVLLLSVMSKLLLLLMTSMIRTDHTVKICNENNYYEINPSLKHDESYIVIYVKNSLQRINWLWILYFSIISPYLFTFGRSLRIIYFKKRKLPKNISTVCFIFLMETFNCIGLSIFLFILLPKMDIIKATMMMNSIYLIPSCLRLLINPDRNNNSNNNNNNLDNLLLDPKRKLTNEILNAELAKISTAAATGNQQHNPTIMNLIRQPSFQSNDDSSFLFDPDDVNNSNNQASTSSSNRFDHLKLAKNRQLAYLNFSLQTFLIIAWTFIFYWDELEYFYLIPIATILVSFEWWENFIIPEAMKSYLKFLEIIREDLMKSRYFIYTFISIWKILLILLLMILNEYLQNGSEIPKLLFQNITESFTKSYTVDLIRDKRNYNSHVLFDTDHYKLYVRDTLNPFWFMLFYILITYLTYSFAKFTCKVCFQTISFAIPLCLTSPVTVSILWAIISIAQKDKCQLIDIFQPFQYIFWNEDDNFNNFNTFDLITEYSNTKRTFWFNPLIWFVWFLGFLSQVTISLHIWKETSERLASTEQLFVNPEYNSVFLDQSLIMNRRSLPMKFLPDDLTESTGNNDQSKSMNDESINNNNKNDIEGLNRSTTTMKDPNDPKTSYNPMYEFNAHVERFIQKNLSNDNQQQQQQQQQDDWTKDWHKICEMMGIEEDSIDAKPDPSDDETIRIYICATMWHEDQNEMFQMLKAVMRLDYEQGLRRIARKEFGDDSSKKLLYDMEVNIFFDDAFEQGKNKEDDNDRIINRFVEQLIDTYGKSANQVFERNLKLEPPTIVPTPYGGKLIWKMPMGTNRLIAHLKDKNLIRHRKRWSQCMYMYYLLGYRLAARKDLDLKRKKTIMNNTFVLALDGDINFRPQAVDLVVDLMLKNNNLGAACGRIHPIGTGPIVWYQKFEYAMGHWLQKATEHVIGCVLCSPGCFSLFRARALMDKSVMHKYTTKPTEALHYVQYDQGEDRWLCTLLLQQGWRIEYCAASDSFTHAPEGFSEFYTQRRRWGPSTMANILDLLGDYKQTVRINDNISYLYILYQGFLMLGTIISPGTIFLMVVSAMNTVVGLSTQTSLIYNMIPLLAFLFVCLKFKQNDIKITFATILSVIYALLMLAVLVGTGIDMYTQGFFSPNSLFFSAMMASFILAAILHPQEFACVLPLPIYMLFIPSMYMLLTIYSITNMNIVSWGTREVKTEKSAKEIAAELEAEQAKAKEQASKNNKKSFLNLSNVTGAGSRNGLFTCMCCSGTSNNPNSSNNNNPDNTELIKTMNLELKKIGKFLNEHYNQQDHQDEQLKIMNKSIKHNDAKNQLKQQEENHMKIQEQSSSKESHKNNDLNQSKQQQQTTNETSTNSIVHLRRSNVFIDANNIDLNVKHNNNNDDDDVGDYRIPLWIKNNKRLNEWPIRFIPKREEEFWLKLIDKYLYPLIENRDEKKRIEQELIDLRNKFVFAFAFLNIIFILFVFMLQIHKDVFGIDIPVGVNGTERIEIEDEDRIEYQTKIIYTRMDPINLTLVVFFGAILIIQCIGMFIHRFGTLAHLLAYTELWDKKTDMDFTQIVAELIKMDQTKLRGNRRRRRRRHHHPRNRLNTIPGVDGGDGEGGPDGADGDNNIGGGGGGDGGIDDGIGGGDGFNQRIGQQQQQQNYYEDDPDYSDDDDDGTDGYTDDDGEDGRNSFKSSNSENEVLKPSQFGDMVEKALQKLKSDQSQIDKMPKIMRKNTINAIRRHEKRQQQQQQQQAVARQHRDSIISAISNFGIGGGGLDRPVSNASLYQNYNLHHRRIDKTQSNLSNSTQDSQRTIVEQQQQSQQQQPNQANVSTSMATASNNNQNLMRNIKSNHLNDNSSSGTTRL